MGWDADPVREGGEGERVPGSIPGAPKVFVLPHVLNFFEECGVEFRTFSKVGFLREKTSPCGHVQYNHNACLFRKLSFLREEESPSGHVQYKHNACFSVELS